MIYCFFVKLGVLQSIIFQVEGFHKVRMCSLQVIPGCSLLVGCFRSFLDHGRSFLAHCRLFQVASGHFRSFQVVPHFGKFVNTVGIWKFWVVVNLIDKIHLASAPVIFGRILKCGHQGKKDLAGPIDMPKHKPRAAAQKNLMQITFLSVPNDAILQKVTFVELKMTVLLAT